MIKSLLPALTLLSALALSGPAMMASAQDHHDQDDHQGWQTKEGYEYRTYQGEHPPGWSKGKKTGWDNCGMPPGQAKKYGCRTYTYQGQPYYYYQGEDGRMHVRRPAGHQDHDHDHDNH
jgi:hypothetical protein